jgi:hypothetical protein
MLGTTLAKKRTMMEYYPRVESTGSENILGHRRSTRRHTRRTEIRMNENERSRVRTALYRVTQGQNLRQVEKIIDEQDTSITVSAHELKEFVQHP